MTEMLLSSEVKGFIPNPAWYFEKDDDEHRQALDLLMMTQGWRRFDWREMAVQGEWNFTQPYEQTPVLQLHVDFNPLRVTPMPPPEMRLLDGDITLSSISNHRSMPNPERRDYKAELALAKKAFKPGLTVHAELVSLSTQEAECQETTIQKDSLRLVLPKYYGEKELFISVADLAEPKNADKAEKRRKKRASYQWVHLADDIDQPLFGKSPTKLVGEADYKAYISWPYPRFVKPYSFYQNHLPATPASPVDALLPQLPTDSVKALQEVQVSKRRRNRLSQFNDAFPAFSVDAYEAWNTIEDAGVPVFNAVNIGDAVLRVYMNDYGINEESSAAIRYGLSPTRRALPRYRDIPVDSLYHPKYLSSLGQDFDFSPGERRQYYGDERFNEDPRFLIDRFVVYTDYQPRLEGSSRYMGENMPETQISVYPIYDGGRRAIYRDRRYILPGFAVPAEFYSPDYSRRTPPEPTD